MNCEMVLQTFGTSDSKCPVTLCRKNGLVDVLATFGSIILIVWVSILGSDWPKYVPHTTTYSKAGRALVESFVKLSYTYLSIVAKGST